MFIWRLSQPVSIFKEITNSDLRPAKVGATVENLPTNYRQAPSCVTSPTHKSSCKIQPSRGSACPAVHTIQVLTIITMIICILLMLPRGVRQLETLHDNNFNCGSADVNNKHLNLPCHFYFIIWRFYMIIYHLWSILLIQQTLIINLIFRENTKV